MDCYWGDNGVNDIVVTPSSGKLITYQNGRRTNLTDFKQIISMTIPCEIEGCHTKWVFCHTFLSYKTGDLSYNCMTFQGFCHTFLSYKRSVLSYKNWMSGQAIDLFIEISILNLYIVSSSINKMIHLEKKDKGRIPKSNLSYIVIHFYSKYILILFSSSFSYCYYYYYQYYFIT